MSQSTGNAKTSSNRFLEDPVAIIEKDSRVPRERVTLEQSLATLIDNERFSDVRFIVGDSQTIVNGHKMLFALSSDVFEQMLYGTLKEQDRDIPIPDITPTGFMNMARFFYSKEIDINASEIYETLEAATKYMVRDLIVALHELVMRKLDDVPNSCLLFDQLVKIESTFGYDGLHQPLPFESLQRVIEINAVRAILNDSFEDIAQETLIQILKFDKLNIEELDLLKSCIRHTEVELSRLGLDATVANKRRIFANIKNLIRYTALDVAGFGKISGIENYLSAEEALSVYLHLCDASKPLMIDYLSPRNVLPLCISVTANSYGSIEVAVDRSELISFSVRVNEDVFVSQLETFDLTQICDLDFELSENGKEMFVYYDIVQRKKIFINFPIPFHLKPNTLYQLSFRFSWYPIPDKNSVHSKVSRLRLSNEMELNSTNEAYKFTFENSISKHCLAKICFYR